MFDLSADRVGLVFCGLLMGVFMIGGAFVWDRAHQKLPKPPRDYPAYCIDPFASRDMGKFTYTLCKMVPMWSTKA